MFNPNQGNALRLQLEKEGAIVRFDGYFCKTQRLLLAPTANAQSRFTRPPETLEVYSPENVFGVPYDRNCLKGIGDYVTEVPGPILYEVAHARIIGYQALIDADSCLYCPAPLIRGPQSTLNERGQSHGGFVLHSQNDTPHVTFAAREEPRYFDKTVLFLHNLEPGNYGSFIFRLLPQLMFAAEAGVKFDAYVTPERTPWFIDALRLVGLPERPVFAVKEVCGDSFRSVFLSTSFDHEGLFSKATRQGFIELVHRAAASGISNGASQKLYVSRILTGSSRPWYRMLENEAKLEEHAVRAGFSVIYPEALTFPEQIKAFAAAQQIVGPSGSGMLNAVFAEDSTRVLDMESFTMTVRQHAKLYSSTHKRYSFLFGHLAEDDESSPIFRRWMVPEERFRVGIDWVSG